VCFKFSSQSSDNLFLLLCFHFYDWSLQKTNRVLNGLFSIIRRRICFCSSQEIDLLRLKKILFEKLVSFLPICFSKTSNQILTSFQCCPVSVGKKKISTKFIFLSTNQLNKVGNFVILKRWKSKNNRLCFPDDQMTFCCLYFRDFNQIFHAENTCHFFTIHTRCTASIILFQVYFFRCL